MTQIHWVRPASDSFNNAADWSGGRAPGPGDDAILDASGTVAYTVTASAPATVNSIQTAPTALLDITANFSATDGTGTGANLGAIRIENGAALTLQGPVVNTGTMEILGTVSPTSIVIGSSVTLSGAGAIFLNFSGGPDQRIAASPGGSVLTDVDNRISGQGTLGDAGMTIVNEAQGFIEAKGGPLLIDTGANTIVNAGFIDAEGAPGDDGITPAQGTIQSPIDNTGILKADGDGASLTFNGAVTGTGRAIISGGVLRFNAAFSQNLDFERSTGTLYLAQSIDYTGFIAQFATSGGEFLDLGDIAFGGSTKASYIGTATSGTLTVTDGIHTARIRFEGNYTGVAFTSVNDDHGGTTITDETKALHWLNPASGLFQTAADWTAGVAPGASNDAILDAPGSTRYTVTVSASQTVRGIQTATTATLAVTDALTATAGTDTGVNAGTILLVNGGTVTAGGALDNRGLISLAASSAHTSLLAAGGLTLSGHGTVALGNSYENIIEGAASGAVLTNIDNVIAGAGYLGGVNLMLVNQAGGIVDANASTPLILDTGAGTAVNAGLIEATGSGGLSIRGTVNGSPGGVIAAAGGNVYLQGATLIGGTLRASGGRIIYARSGLDTFDGTASAVNVQGRVVIDNGEGLTLMGSIANTGLVDLVSDGAPTILTIGAAGATLTGAGQVFLGNDNAAAEIIGTSATATLTNAGNVIAGAGDVGGGRLTLVNETAGVIVGEYAVALIVDTGANTIVNAGRIENSGTGGTIVRSAVANSGALVAEGGTLTVKGAVTGSGEALIYGGTLDFASTFSQNVGFKSVTGVLELAQSQSFAATVFGFSKAGGTSLDLTDIAFGGSTTASYGGTASGGTLTLTDGTHTAHIKLSGDYTASKFVAGSDGHGGTTIVDPTAHAPATAHRFVAAMAGFGAAAGASMHVSDEVWSPSPAMLARPRAVAA